MSDGRAATEAPLDHEKRSSGRGTLIAGIALLVAGLGLAGFAYVMALASAFSSASGSSSASGFATVLLVLGGLATVAGLGLIVAGAAKVTIRADSGVLVALWCLAALPSWFVLPMQLHSDVQNCSLRRTDALCDGAALAPVRQGRSQSVTLRLERPQPGVEFRSVLPDYAPAWTSRHGDELHALDAWIYVTEKWELVLYEPPPLRPSDSGNQRWVAYLRERVSGAEERRWITTERPNAIVALSDDDLLLQHGPTSRLMRLSLRTRESEAIAKDGPESIIDGNTFPVVLPDETTLLMNSNREAPRLLRRGAGRLQSVADAAHASAGIFPGRERMIDVVDERGEYDYSTWVTPPGRGDAPVVAAQGYTCVGAQSGVCLLDVRDSTRGPDLATRLRAAVDVRVVFGVLVFVAHLVLSWLFWRAHLDVRKRRSSGDDPEDAVVTSQRARRAFVLGVLSIASVMLAVWMVGMPG